MTETIIFENANVVTPEHVIRGYVVVAEGKIIEVGEGPSPERGIDLGGDVLIPGLIELHTDHLEVHFMPRPKVEWPAISAVLAHDAQIAGCGITTVFDALRVGNDYDEERFGAKMQKLAAAISAAKQSDMTRAEHFIHLRCEIACADVVDEMEPFLKDENLKLVSVMDHTPGQRQFTDISKWKTYYAGKKGASDAQLDAIVERRRTIYASFAEKNRARIVGLCQRSGVALASHDDTTVEQVGEAVRDGMTIAEFPTTVEAAEASHRSGLKVLMGAPNVVRGGSHSGNVAARTLAEEGLLDVLSSDYVPQSLLLGAFDLADVPAVGGLPGAMRLVTKNAAEASGLGDRGEITAGKRADLVRVELVSGMPVVRGVWRQGQRVS